MSRMATTFGARRARLLTVGAAAAMTLLGLAAQGGLASSAATTGDGGTTYKLHTSSDCRSEARIARNAIARTDIRVDIDGDGLRDKVAVRTDLDARKTCRVFVAVKVGHA